MLGIHQSRTRLFLVVILTAILIIYAARLVTMQFDAIENPDAPDLMDFSLEVYGEPGGIELEEDSKPAIPVFEPETGQWTLEGSRVSDFASLAQGLEVGPHGSSPFVVIDLPEGATADDYREAIASLADQGICRLGVLSPAPAGDLLPPYRNPDMPPKGFVAVFRVLSVKRDTVVSRRCKDRFPAWP